EPDEAGLEAERVFPQERLPERLASGPQKEDHRHRQLRQQQDVGQDGVGENGALCLHRSAGVAGPRARRGPARSLRQLLLAWNSRSSSLPRSTAASSACWAVLEPLSRFWNSSSTMSRTCTKLPKRRP